MFINIETRRKESVSLNVSYILFVTPEKDGCVIFDIVGNDFTLRESYESVMERINALLQLENSQCDLKT